MTAKRLLVATVVSALALAGAAVAYQFPAGQQGAAAQPAAIAPQVPTQERVGFPLGNWYAQSRIESIDLAKKYANAEKEEDRRDLRRKLEEALSKEFEAQAQRQQKELDELEKQIEALRTLLRKRKDAKSDIIDRRIEQLVQDAQGLGWNTPGGSRYGLYTSGVGAFGAVPDQGIGTPAAPATPAGSRASTPSRSSTTPRRP